MLAKAVLQSILMLNDTPHSRASPLPQLNLVHQQYIGRLSGRHRRQASSHIYGSDTPFAPHHSTGRALARLQLLILIHPPYIGRLSGGVHPGSGAQRRSTQSNTLHVGRRAADRRAVSPDGYRNAEPRRGAGRSGRAFLGTFLALKKVPRRKGETASRRYRRNGYVHHQQEHSRPKGRQGQKSPTASPKSKEEC